MHILVYMCVYACMAIHMYTTCTYVYIHTPVSACMHICAHACYMQVHAVAGREGAPLTRSSPKCNPGQLLVSPLMAGSPREFLQLDCCAASHRLLSGWLLWKPGEPDARGAALPAPTGISAAAQPLQQESGLRGPCWDVRGRACASWADAAVDLPSAQWFPSRTLQTSCGRKYVFQWASSCLALVGRFQC